VRVGPIVKENTINQNDLHQKRGLFVLKYFDLFIIPIVPEVERFGLTAGLLLSFKRKDPQLLCVVLICRYF
jgi:hypothetical protein